MEAQAIKEREISVLCQCYLGLFDRRVASASWSPFSEGSPQRRQGVVQEGEGIGSGDPLGLGG